MQGTLLIMSTVRKMVGTYYETDRIFDFTLLEFGECLGVDPNEAIEWIGKAMASKEEWP